MALKENAGVNELKRRANISGSNTTMQQEPPKELPQELDSHVIHEKKKRKYLRLDITDCQDYIALMTEHEKASSGKHISMTKYILRLIDADKQRNLALYEKLLEIENMKRNLI